MLTQTLFCLIDWAICVFKNKIFAIFASNTKNEFNVSPGQINYSQLRTQKKCKTQLINWQYFEKKQENSFIQENEKL